MIRSIVLIPLFYWMQVLPYSVILEKSVKEINSRYSGTSSNKLVEEVNLLSEDGAIRFRFYKVLKESQIKDPIVIIEYSSSGETFTYNCRVIGYSKNGTLLKLDYSYHSHKEKVITKRLRNVDSFNLLMSTMRSIEYDDEKKLPFPSEVMLVSYADGNSKWQFRLSESPPISVVNIISL